MTAAFAGWPTVELTTTHDLVRALVGGDLDGDGVEELVVASSGDATVAWWEVATHVRHVLSRDAEGVADAVVVDLDGDGRLDVAWAEEGADRVAWARNLGGGGFDAPAVVTSAVPGARALAVADLDGDGDPDLAVAGGASGGVAWVENLGGGAFGLTRAVATVNAPFDLLAGDLDADGAPDLAYADVDGAVAWFENQGGGTFGAARAVDTVPYPRRLAGGDLDGDGDLDLVVASDDWAGRSAWFRNDGAGHFVQVDLTAPEVGVEDAVLADVDRDGDLDLLTTRWPLDRYGYPDRSRITVERNDGHGVFGPDQEVWVQDTWLVLGLVDVDGDGDPDLVSTPNLDTADALGWFRNTNGSFGSPVGMTVAAADATEVWTQDLDADGDADVVSVSRRDDKVAAYLTSGGVPGPQQVLPFDVAHPESAVLADVDGDGDLDALVASGWLTWVPGTRGGFGAAEVVDPSSGGTRVVACDLDGNGDLDAITANDASFDASSGPDILANYLVAGHFTGPRSLLDDEGVAVACTDVEGDGDPDVVAIGWHEAWWLENPGNLLQPFVTHPISGVDAGTNEAELRIADLDGDQRPDLVVAGQTQVMWVPNLGRGAFGAPRTVAGGCCTWSVAVADLDLDGRPDVITAKQDIGQIAWQANTGGAFGPATQIARSIRLAAGVGAGDLDGDGDLDVVSLSEEAVWWHANPLFDLTEQGHTGLPHTGDTGLPATTTSTTTDTGTPGTSTTPSPPDGGTPRSCGCASSRATTSGWALLALLLPLRRRRSRTVDA